MSELPAIGNDASMSTQAVVSEELSETQVKGLVEEAKTAIKEKNLDRASQIIIQLSQVHHQAQAPKGWVDAFRGWISGSKCLISNNDLYDLFSAFCKENHEEGKKLIPALSKNFSIEVEGQYYKVYARGFDRSFTVPIKTDAEAKALIDYIYPLSHSRKFEDLKEELPRLAKLCAERKVGMEDFKKLYLCLISSNSTFAIRCIPIFEDVYEIRIEGNRLLIKDTKSSESSSFTARSLSFVDCDRNLEEIATKENPSERLFRYLFLARHQMERAPEMMKKAENELEQIEDYWERVLGECAFMFSHLWFQDTINFERMAVMLERKLSNAEETEKKYYFLAKLSVLRALACLEKKDRNGYIKQVVILVQKMKHIKEAEPLKELQKDLESLKSKREETFPLDQMELHARKV